MAVDCLSNHQSGSRKNFYFIIICSDVRAQTRQRVSILVWSIMSFHLVGQKNVMVFSSLMLRSFWCYDMNDFAAITSNGYYTLENNFIQQICFMYDLYIITNIGWMDQTWFMIHWSTCIFFFHQIINPFILMNKKCEYKDS